MNDTVRMMLRNSLKNLRAISVTSVLTWAGGYALGILTGIYPKPSLIAFAIIMLIFGVIALRNYIRANQASDFTPWESTLRDPDNEAAAAVARSNEHYLVVGQAIEIIPHPQLNSREAIERLGWDPAEVNLIDLQSDLEVQDLAFRAGGLREFHPPDGTKFSLVSTSYVISDSPNLALETKRTTYFTIQSILPLVKSDPAIRAEYGRLDPRHNKIPHSLCLHYLVRFSSGDILCMRRDHRAVYHSNMWSFSGEEQLEEDDFKAERPSLAFFRRAFCEEVLSLRDKIPLEERWRTASPIVQAMRLWSVFLEERIHNFSLLGFFQLNCDPHEFTELHNSLVDRGIGTRDREGSLYFIREKELLGLLVDGACRVRPLFNGADEQVRAENLHPTSRYRIFRLLRAVNRRPLDIGDYERTALRRTQRIVQRAAGG